MNISKSVVNFKDYELKTRNACFEAGRRQMKAQLEDWDCHLMKNRDKERFRHKGKERNTIKTVLGEVEYERVGYDVMEDGKKVGRVHLLDEAIGTSGSGQYSELMSEMIVQACCEGSYREAAREVSEMTGQTISHTAAWKVVQAVGEQVDEQELHDAKLAAKSKGAGTIETDALFEEQDGIWLKLQGNDRRKHGKSKEMKVAIAYDGAEKTGKNRFGLANKVACANFEGGDKFVKRKDGVIASVYNVDEVGMRFLGGDGAQWIRRSQTDETVHFQLDPYHRNMAVLKCVADPEVRKNIFRTLYSKDIGLLLHVIETEALSTDDEGARENYLELLNYFESNKDGLVPIHRRGFEMPKPPDGKVYRRLGAMESNVFTIIGNRMKGRRALWSIKGGNNLARLLCLKHTDRLSGVLESLSSCVLPERYAEEITVETSAAMIPEDIGKGYNGFRQTLIPSNLKWFKGIAAIKPLPC